MRFTNLLLILGTLGFVSSQTVQELAIFNEETRIYGFTISEQDTLILTFNVDPLSVEFIYSVLYRIPGGLFSRDTLEHFSANGAMIRQISATDFANAVNLKVLELESNQITELPDNIFSNALNLEVIQLGNNNIVTIAANAFAGLTNLKRLVMYGNSIATLSSSVFSTLVGLEYLDLGVNSLVDLNFADFGFQSNLSTLWLEYNDFVEIKDNDIVSPSLMNLYIYGNKIEKLQNYVFNDVPNLTNLNLMSNDISEIEDYAFAGLSRLTYLGMFSNEIEYLPPAVFMPLTSLISLDLGYNRIETITFRLFSNLRNLVSLWMERNRLSSFEFRKTVAMENLKYLYINDNNLTSLNMTKIGYLLPELEIISMSENEFSCEVAADMLIELRRFNINYIIYYYEESDVLMEGIACKEYYSSKHIPQTTQSRKSHDNELMNAEKLKHYPIKDDRTEYNKRPEIGALPSN